MNICESYAALLDLYVDGELSPAELLRIETHLNECPACRTYVDDLLAIRAAFPKAEDTAVPDGFVETVMTVVRASTVPHPRHKHLWTTVLAPLAACFAVILLLHSGVFPLREQAKENAMCVFTAEIAQDTVSDETTPEALPQAESYSEPEAAYDTSTANAPAEMAGATVDQAEIAAKSRQDIGTAYAYVLFLPADHAELLAEYSPVSQTKEEICYELEMVDADHLQNQLKADNRPYTREDGIDPTGSLVLVILSQ